MKARKIAETEFKPFSVEITFECVQDMLNIWHRMNLSTEAINDIVPKGHKTKTEKESGINPLWLLVDSELDRLGIKR